MAAFFGVIIGGILTIIITIVVERLRSPRVRLAIGDCITLQPRGPLAHNWHSLRVAVSNEPLPSWADWWLLRLPALQCRAEILFLRLDGTLFISDPMVGRWTGGSPEPQVVHIQQPNGTIPVLTNPEELKNTVDIYPGETEQLDVAVRIETENQAYGWNNETYFYPNWRNSKRELNHERYLVKVTVNSSGRKCTGFFNINNDGPFTSFTLTKLTPEQQQQQMKRGSSA
ncbi:MAG TPA: hypothetical protein VGJ20_25400 [Xanthobacteraceae bacterium]|jgi:hypothetical protein